jgi:hypothetical protein
LTLARRANEGRATDETEIQSERTNRSRNRPQNRLEPDGRGRCNSEIWNAIYDLLARERKKIALTKDEASLVCLAVGSANLQLDAVGSPRSWVGDFADVMSDELKFEMGDELKVDFRKLNPKLRCLTDAQTIAVLDAADAYTLGRRWIPTAKKDIERPAWCACLRKTVVPGVGREGANLKSRMTEFRPTAFR